MNESEKYTLENIAEILKNETDAIFYVNGESDTYRSIARKGIFSEMFSEIGNYHDLIEKLWFHFADSTDKITEDYHVFVPTFGKFKGKYSKRLRMVYNDSPFVVQMSIYPLTEPNQYLLTLIELDNSEYIQDFFTHEKVQNIQNTFLFSMYVDLIKDTTSSISITEISDDPINATELSYTNWRGMIVNMIFADDQQLFLDRTSPDYLKKNLAPGRTTSFDCQMQNLEGTYIWVKLIFSRVSTNNLNDFRFVFMVQNIHDSSVKLLSTLKKYEELAAKDTLTGTFNHGRIETELLNAIENKKTNPQDVSLLIFDIDKFKDVNDTYGHSIGDVTLKHLVTIASELFKPYDIKLGRWGGEEFLAVCCGYPLEKVSAIAEELRTAIEHTEFETIGNLTCSFGITEINDADDLKSAFERVDSALYDAKSDGRNCVVSK